MSTTVVQYDFKVSGATEFPRSSPRITAADFTKFAGSSGDAKSGTESDHRRMNPLTAEKHDT
jgi:hypothetical protein